MERDINTEYHFVRNSSGLSGEESAKLSDDDRVVMTEHLTEELDKITKFTKIFLNEVV